jgi:hypothetical protein
MENLTFNELPQAVTELHIKLSNIESLLLAQSKLQQPETEEWYNLDQLCLYLPDKPSKATVYSWVSKSLIPTHKGSKKLRFQKSEIDNWLKDGRKKTLAEIDKLAAEYIKSKKSSR